MECCVLAQHGGTSAALALHRLGVQGSPGKLNACPCSAERQVRYRVGDRSRHISPIFSRLCASLRCSIRARATARAWGLCGMSRRLAPCTARVRNGLRIRGSDRAQLEPTGPRRVRSLTVLRRPTQLTRRGSWLFKYSTSLSESALPAGRVSASGGVREGEVGRPMDEVISTPLPFVNPAFAAASGTARSSQGCDECRGANWRRPAQ